MYKLECLVNYISASILWVSVPAEQRKGSQMTPVWVSAWQERDPTLGNPNLIMGSKQACFTPRGDTISVFQVCTPCKHLWKGSLAKNWFSKHSMTSACVTLKRDATLTENYIWGAGVAPYGFNSRFTDNEDRYLVVVSGHFYILFLKLHSQAFLLQDLQLAWIFTTNLGDTLVILYLQFYICFLI